MARTRVKPATNVVPIAEARRTRPSGMWARVHGLARALVRRGQATPAQYRPNPFTPATPLPGVIGKDSKAAIPKMALDAAEAWKMAADAGPGGNPGWVGGYAQMYAASAYLEGQDWLGYAVLAILSQRPEYRIATDIYATDMTREWIEFKSKSEDENKRARIDQLVERLEALRLKQVVKAAIENDGLQGRGQIYVDTGDEDDAEELKSPLGSGGDDSRAKFGEPEKESARDQLAMDFDPRDETEREPSRKRKRIRALRAIEPMWCYPSQYNADDPLKADWYRPDVWWVMGKEVHCTRLLTFVSNPVPNMLMPAYSFGGLSRTQMMKPYVDFWLRNRTSASDLLNNFSVPVLSTDLEVTTMDEGSELLQRVMTFNVLRDNQSTMVINKDSEEFSIAQTSLAGVKDLVGQSAEHLCLPSRVPIVKYFGDQPSGLNASSEGVIRLFYDSIKALQESLIREPIQTIVSLVMIEMWGEVDDDIEFTFKDLWQLDEAGKAAIQKTKADTRAVDMEAGVVSPEEAREAAAHDPDSQYAGLDLSEPLPEPDPDLFGDPDDPEGTGGSVGQQGMKPNRRDLAGITSAAARSGGEATGGFSDK